jgi:hypothetical protein
MSKKEQRIWQYVLANRKATVEEIAEACDVSPAFVAHLLSKIGTPEEIWRNADTGPGAWYAIYETENEDILAAGYPDDNPKTALGEAKPKISSTPTIGIREMGKVFELGAKKYGRYNWRLHQVSATVYYDAAWRHLSAWFDGEDLDPESGVSHLAHVMACMTILMDAQQHGMLNDNRKTAEDVQGIA